VEYNDVLLHNYLDNIEQEKHNYVILCELQHN